MTRSGRTAMFQAVKLFTSNESGASFTARNPTATQPTGAGVIDTADLEPDLFQFFFWGAGNDNDTFACRFTKYERLGTLWVPMHLGELVCTMGTKVGVAGQPILNTERLVDGLTASASHSSLEAVNPGANLVAWAELDARGAPLLAVDLAQEGGAATGFNCAYRPLPL